MRTACPACQTVFHVTSAQLRARSGRVRCGHCAAAFNALEQLVDDVSPGQPTADTPITPAPPPTSNEFLEQPADVCAPGTTPGEETRETIEPADAAPQTPAATDEPGMETRNQAPDIEPPVIEPPVIVPDHQHVPLTAEEASPPDDGASGEPLPTSESSAGMDAEVGTPATPVTPLIPVEPAPKPVTGETNEPPDYRRWVANSNGTPVPVASRQPYRGLYALTASLLLLALVGQMLFHFRTPLSVAFPALEPTLTALSNALGTTMPLSRHIEQIGIESSDLQIERGPNRTLALQATLRNRADYPQAYPALELTLTDVNETVLVRRVLLPEEYLSPPAADDPAFPAHADLDVRLWLAAKEVDSSGYRLYVFYP